MQDVSYRGPGCRPISLRQVNDHGHCCVEAAILCVVEVPAFRALSADKRQEWFRDDCSVLTDMSARHARPMQMLQSRLARSSFRCWWGSLGQLAGQVAFVGSSPVVRSALQSLRCNKLAAHWSTEAAWKHPPHS